MEGACGILEYLPQSQGEDKTKELSQAWPVPPSLDSLSDHCSNYQINRVSELETFTQWIYSQTES